MSDEELLAKALRAGNDYNYVFNMFPDKIGIDYYRLQKFGYTFACFIVRDEEFNCVITEIGPISMPYGKRHIVQFEPVLGNSVSPFDVYLPDPNDNQKLISGEDIAKRAKAKRMEFADD